MAARVPNVAAACGPDHRSLTTARPTATPLPATTPWTRRSATSTGPLGLSAHATEASRKASEPATSSRRRPTASLTGPSSSWPAASPTRKEVTVSCATVSVVDSDARTCGRAAR